jgi:uncharacterized membrane protein YeaQ/YmgE (transglycosylase-associated protein family)
MCTIMLQAVLWGIISGVVARSLLERDKPGWLVTVAAGFGGSVAGFLVGHELLRMHEFHLFEPESLVPAVAATAIILMLIRRVARASTRTWLFR